MGYRPITKGSQCDRVMKYMQEHGAITQLDCYKMRPMILHLASRITDLRQNHNVLIFATRAGVYDENGKELSHWTEYRLPTEEELTNAEAE